MEQRHINERGSHTTVIEQAQPIITIFKKHIPDFKVSPGKIEARVGAKSSSIKFKHINNELYEMVIVHNSSRQEFKVFTRSSYEELVSVIKKEKKTSGWIVNCTDMRLVNTATTFKNTEENLDSKYKV